MTNPHPEFPLPGKGRWWACEFPERPLDTSHTAMRWDCRPCLVYAYACIRAGHGGATNTSKNALYPTLTIEEFYRLSWHLFPDLPQIDQEERDGL